MDCPMDCTMFHDSCLQALLKKVIDVSKYTLKIYTIAHGLPALIFKNKELLKNPTSFFAKLIPSILKSCGFLSGFVLSMRIFHCYIHYRLVGKFTSIYLLTIFRHCLIF